MYLSEKVRYNIAINIKKTLFLLLIIIPYIGFSQTKYDQNDEFISEPNNFKNEDNYQQTLTKYKSIIENTKDLRVL